MKRFKLDPDADSAGTHKIGDIALPPAALIRRFGKPEKCDEYKVSGVFSFTDEAGKPYSVYDYKSTSLYNDDELSGREPTLPSPEKFWANDRFADFSIGGLDECDVEAFSNWLALEVGA